MKITVLGAAGKTGIEVVRQALAAGHSVVGVVRQADGVKAHQNLTLVIGDATNPQDIARASKDSDVIMSTLGTTSMQSTLMTDAVKAVIAASKVTGCKRFILMSSFAVEKDRLAGVAKMVSAMMKGVVNDKSTSESLIRSSDLDWTIVYAARLTTQPKGSGLRIMPETEKIRISHKIARADVAAFMLQEAENNAYVKADVTIAQ
jgi:putative NADH-flavin reductase